ncbi:hypothetical protein E4U53_001986, partial [Claviceps sorghi]
MRSAANPTARNSGVWSLETGAILCRRRHGTAIGRGQGCVRMLDQIDQIGQIRR